MSNLAIPKVYRSVIDSVVNSVRLDFDELAVEEEILALLQQKWETKLVESGVADFDPTPPPSHHTPSSASLNRRIPPSALPSQLQEQEEVKPTLSSSPVFKQEAQHSSLPVEQGGGGSGEDHQWNGGLKGGGAARGDIVFEGLSLRLRGGAGDEEDEDGLKTPLASASQLPGTSSPDVPNENDLNSDLDEEESEDDDEDEPLARRNMVLCTFEKVSHQKRKWKATLRSGIAHIDGKDYVFDKCGLEVVLA